MTTKYIVGFEDDIIIACKSRADAEEFYFSIIEESAYDVFCAKIQARNWTLNDYADDLLKKAPRRFYTVYMRALWNNESGLWIRAVKELD
jgi:hypothetical protein